MCLAGVSVRRVEDITETLWDGKASHATISELNKRACIRIKDQSNRPLQGDRSPYVYVDGCCEILDTAESVKENKASWGSFF